MSQPVEVVMLDVEPAASPRVCALGYCAALLF